MATLLQKANQLVKLSDDSIDAFLSTLPATERKLYSEILNLVKELKLVRGSIEKSVENIRLVNKLRSSVEGILQEHSYLKNVKEFKKVYDAVTLLQNEYFSLIAVKFKPTAVLKEIKKQTVKEVNTGLTERGLGTKVTDELTDILNLNIQTQQSYATLTEQLRSAILPTDEGGGIIQRHAGQLITDSVNQYTATYSKIISDDLGLEWFQYIGSLIITSRPFCVELIGKRYVHKSEISKIIHGNIDGKKVSLAGLNPDTTIENFQVLRGGYNCRHQLLPVSEVAVPRAIRIEIYSQLGIDYDAQGFKIAA
jgi:hypothetical protein